MVDSIGGGFKPTIDPVKRVEPTDRKTQGASFAEELAKTSDGPAATDEVALSPEALEVAQAQQAARDIRVAVEVNPDAKLGLDPNFDEAV